MKGEKGVTLVSLMMYLIALSILIGISSTMIGYFYKNSDNITFSSSSNQEYTRVLQYMTDDVNSGIVEEATVKNSGNLLSIRLKDNIVHQYIFSNKKIYFINKYDDGENEEEIKTQICIASNVNTCSFTYDEQLKKINLSLKINNVNYFNTFIVQ